MTKYEVVDTGTKVPPVRHNLPWNDMKIGTSFMVEETQIGLQTLRALAYQAGRRLKKKFRVFDHKEYFEVARVEPDLVVAFRPHNW